MSYQPHDLAPLAGPAAPDRGGQFSSETGGTVPPQSAIAAPLEPRTSQRKGGAIIVAAPEILQSSIGIPPFYRKAGRFPLGGKTGQVRERVPLSPSQRPYHFAPLAKPVAPDRGGQFS
ncbi:MAG: hypothetical protein AAF399_19255 [Bacteroidota bacterium]